MPSTLSDNFGYSSETLKVERRGRDLNPDWVFTLSCFRGAEYRLIRPRHSVGIQQKWVYEFINFSGEIHE